MAVAAICLGQIARAIIPVYCCGAAGPLYLLRVTCTLGLALLCKGCCTLADSIAF